jgi:predicted Zn-dependent peptidase
MKYTTYKFKNGATVILVPHKTLNSVNIEATIKYGAAHENSRNAGITHFLEHISLTSTTKWPNKNDLNKLIEFNGASYNASTGKEITNYFINLPYTKIEFGVEYIFEILYNSNFNDEDIESERKVILDEISKSENSFERRAYKFFTKSLSEKKSSYTQEILGTKENVQNFTREQLLTHYRKMHDPANLTIIVSGNFKEAQIKKLISKYFENIPSKEEPQNFPEENILNNVIKFETDSKSDLILFTNSFKYKGLKEISFKEESVLQIVFRILANTTTSRLYSRLREKEGLLYDIYVDSHLYFKFGVISFIFEIEPTKFEQALKIYVEEFQKILKDGITKEELNHYKEYSYNRSLLRYDSFNVNKNLIISALILDEKVYTAKAVLKSIKQVKLSEINSFINENLNLKNSSFLLYGNVDENTLKILNKNI